MPSSDFYVNKVAESSDVPTVDEGASGYFSTPSDRLDPSLFHGDVFRDDVRHFVLHTLYDFWGKRFARPETWSTVWAAGSGISYQWSASRGNGDLDILIGVDYPSFYSANPDYQGIPENDMADIFNKNFKQGLWPSTANWRGFEVTFYVNPNSTDIRDINPYAAYNLTTNEWTVRPPVVGADPRAAFGKSYWDQITREKYYAKGLVMKYGSIRNEIAGMTPGSPGHTNALAKQRLVVEQARALFNDIHGGRRMAFGPGGSGYGDFYNFRWQAHKEAGTVQAVHALTVVGSEARKEQEIDQYGHELDDAAEALTKASLWARG
jgi:hypothetical protein